MRHVYGVYATTETAAKMATDIQQIVPEFEQLSLRSPARGGRSSTRTASCNSCTPYNQNRYVMNVDPTQCTDVSEQLPSLASELR